MTRELEKATLGGGCFWCLEAVYLDVEGVQSVVSGYAGGEVENPTYQEVCNGTTGHAEVVQITYDPAVISYEDILTIFWHIHDPTTLNRQGADVGTQYRSIILYHNEEQRQLAEKSRQAIAAEGVWRNPIVTQLESLGTFYPAEAYHQDYYSRNRFQPYCMMVINPKVKKFRKQFKDKLRATAS